MYHKAKLYGLNIPSDVARHDFSCILTAAVNDTFDSYTKQVEMCISLSFGPRIINLNLYIYISKHLYHGSKSPQMISSYLFLPYILHTLETWYLFCDPVMGIS